MFGVNLQDIFQLYKSLVIILLLQIFIAACQVFGFTLIGATTANHEQSQDKQCRFFQKAIMQFHRNSSVYIEPLDRLGLAAPVKLKPNPAGQEQIMTPRLKDSAHSTSAVHD